MKSIKLRRLERAAFLLFSSICILTILNCFSIVRTDVLLWNGGINLERMHYMVIDQKSFYA